MADLKRSVFECFADSRVLETVKTLLRDIVLDDAGEPFPCTA
jgi:hypothetical protein